jgi:hypothetical protein
MDNELENQDALNLEGDQDTTLENESGDDGEKLAKTQEYAKNQKIRAEKAEAELKKFKSQQKPETLAPKTEEPKSNEPDLVEKLEKVILKTEGITNPDDMKFVLGEANRLKIPVDEILQEDYVKTRLKSAQTQREAEAGMPGGSGKGSGGSAKNTVEYWVDRKKADGTYETPADRELAGKVIDARINKDKANQMFSELEP